MATKKSSKKPVKATKRGLLEEKPARRPATKKAVPTKKAVKKADGSHTHESFVDEREEVGADHVDEETPVVETAIEWKTDFPKSDFDKYGLIARDDLKADMIKAGLSGDSVEYNRIKTVLGTFDENQKVEGLKYGDENTERRGMDGEIILD